MFVHLYGSLGPLPEQLASLGGHPVPLGAPDTEDVFTLGVALARVEHEIQIVHTTDPPSDPFADAVGRSSTAEQVFFLGFGFGKKNVERLRTQVIPQAATILCTTYDMTKDEIKEFIAPAFPRHRIAAEINGTAALIPIRYAHWCPIYETQIPAAGGD